MKLQLSSLLAVALSLGLPAAHAQLGGGGMPAPQGPSFGGSLSKLLGDNSAFSAVIEIQTKGPSGDDVAIPGKMSFHEGKSRMEIDLSKAMGANMPAEAVAQIKAMGMDSIVIISRPEKKTSYTTFPGLHAYLETAIPDNETPEATSNYKVQSTELGKETVDGHPCIKNKVVVTDNKGTNHVSTVWNATDLKKFPVKIEATEGGKPMTMLFKQVKLAKPEESQFAAPSDFKRYDSYTTLIMEEMMKRQGGGSPPQPTR